MASIDPGADKADPAEVDPMLGEADGNTFEDDFIDILDDFDDNLEPGERALKWLEMEDGDGDENNGDENIDSDGNNVNDNGMNGNNEGNSIDINDIDMKDAEGGEDINKEGAIEGEPDSEKKDAAQKDGAEGGSQGSSNAAAKGKQVIQKQSQKKKDREVADPFCKVFNSIFLPMALPSTSEDPMGQNVLQVVGHFLETSAVVQKNNTGNSGNSPANTMDLKIRKLLRAFCLLNLRKQLTPATLQHRLKFLQNEDYVVVWVRGQNAIVVFKKVNDGKEALIHTWDVQQTQGNVAKIERIFQEIPQHSYRCEWKDVYSPVFCTMLVELARTQQGANPTSIILRDFLLRSSFDIKRNDLDITRNDLGSSRFQSIDSKEAKLTIDDYLGKGDVAKQGDAENNSDPHPEGVKLPFMKKIRDEWREEGSSEKGSQKAAWRRSPGWFAVRSVLQFLVWDLNTGNTSDNSFEPRLYYKSMVQDILSHVLRQVVEVYEKSRDEKVIRLSSMLKLGISEV